MVALLASGRSPRALAANALEELAGSTLPVAVMDELRGESSLLEEFGLEERGDLLHLIDGHTALAALSHRLAEGLYHVSIAGLSLALPLLEEDHRDRVLAGIAELQRRCQLLVVRANADGEFPGSPFLLAAPRRLLVVEASASGVTEAYAIIKRLAAAGAGDLMVAVAGARRRGEACELFAQLEELVRLRVGLPLCLVGEVGHDELAARLIEHAPSRRDRDASAAFLRRVAAWSRSRAGLVGARG